MIIKSIALLLLSIFYVSYIAKLVILKRQNIQVDILGKGQKSKSGVILEILLKCITYLGVAIQFGSVIWDKQIGNLPVLTIMRENGFILMLSGGIVFILAIVTMKSNWRAGYSKGQDTELVTTGIYKYSRNPAFLGFDMLYIGCALAFPNPINIIVTMVAVVLFHFQILGEEKFLADTFEERYTDYKYKTMRYLGKKN